MKKTNNHKYSIKTLTVTLAAFGYVLPVVAGAQTLNTAFLNNKTCLVKYQAEVVAVNKLIDVKKADAKLLEIKAVRKEEDKTIEKIFDQIEQNIDTPLKKEIIDDKKEIILKAVSDRRSKTDELQNSIRITKPEVETIVKSTLSEYSDPENSKNCPLLFTPAKDIRAKNIQKLKKLAADKKEIYQKQTKEIQDGFSANLREALSGLSEEIIN